MNLKIARLAAIGVLVATFAAGAALAQPPHNPEGGSLSLAIYAAWQSAEAIPERVNDFETSGFGI